jgi:hypothetical protein
MNYLEIFLTALHWSFLGVIYLGVALIVAIIFGECARYGRRDNWDEDSNG